MENEKGIVIRLPKGKVPEPLKVATISFGTLIWLGFVLWV
jgi:hypothetical protein